MDLKVALPDDTEKVRRLWEYCFEDPTEFNDWFFENRYRPENTLVAVSNNHIVSALQLLPYIIQLRGIPMETSYLVGVSTWPEHRGKGYIKQLLYYALQEMRRKKQWISILLPFQYEFYRKYGWETCYSHILYEGSLEDFSSYAATSEILGQFHPINATRDIPLLAQSYSLFTKPLNGFVLRNYQDWSRLLKDIDLDGGYAYLYSQGENILGYIIYYIINRQFYIRELAFSDEKSKKEMLKFVTSHTDMVDRIEWKAPACCHEKALLQRYNIKWSESPFVMGRIVDAAKALESIHVKYNEKELDFTLRIIDPFLEWNNQTYRITSADQRIYVCPTHKTPDFIVPVTVLTQLFWGYISPYQAINQNLIDVCNFAKFEEISAIFFDTVPYIYEDY